METRQNEKTPLLEVRDLSVSFRMYDGSLEQRRLEVISSLSMTVYPGEILAIAGSSGSGKSLLASAILGILPANASTGGEMYFDGQPLTAERQRKLRGGGIALVPQSVAYLDPLMRVGPQADGHRKPRPTERRRGLFRRLGLPEEAERLYPFQLSGGMAQRVSIARALAGDPSVILADEPTGALDSRTGREVLRFLQKLNAEGDTVVLITHDNSIAVQAERIIRLEDGRIVYDGDAHSPDAFVASPLFEAQMEEFQKMRAKEGGAG